MVGITQSSPGVTWLYDSLVQPPPSLSSDLHNKGWQATQSGITHLYLNSLYYVTFGNVKLQYARICDVSRRTETAAPFLEIGMSPLIWRKTASLRAVNCAEPICAYQYLSKTHFKPKSIRSTHPLQIRYGTGVSQNGWTRLHTGEDAIKRDIVLCTGAVAGTLPCEPFQFTLKDEH